MISFRIFTSKPSPLASEKTSFLASFRSLSSFSICSIRSTNERIRSPAIPTVSLMNSPYRIGRALSGRGVTEPLMAEHVATFRHVVSSLAIASPGSIGRRQQLRHGRGIGSRQRSDAAPIRKLDGLKPHDLETGIEAFLNGLIAP